MHKILPIIIVLAIFGLGFLISKNALSKIYDDITVEKESKETVIQKSGCDADCQKEIASQIALAIATLSASPKSTENTPTPAALSPKPPDTYIQISGSGSTESTDWVDVPGTDFSFDIGKDFGKGASFAWEGFLRISNANGTAFARIFDATHGIGVDGSQISVKNTDSFTRTNSTNLNFWSGRNTYRVQIKSLNTLNVDYMGGKIRVSY